MPVGQAGEGSLLQRSSPVSPSSWEQWAPSSSGAARPGVPAYARSCGSPQQFTAKERDDESGLDYFLARYYASSGGRFTSVDPGSAGSNTRAPQSWNGYAYALNRPLALTDPDGRSVPCGDPSDLSTCGGADNAAEQFRAARALYREGRYIRATLTALGAASTAMDPLGFTPSPVAAAKIPGTAAKFGKASSGASRLADSAQAAGGTRGVAAELRVGGDAFSDVSTSVPGRQVPEDALNPAVGEALDAVPPSNRSDFHGKCAEPSCISQAMDAGVNPAGGTIEAVRIRKPGNPNHGTLIGPCESCRRILEFFGITVVE